MENTIGYWFYTGIMERKCKLLLYVAREKYFVPTLGHGGQFLWRVYVYIDCGFAKLLWTTFWGHMPV